MNTEERKKIKEIRPSYTEDDIDALANLGFRVANKKEIEKVVGEHYLPSSIASYFWLISEQDIVTDNLDIQIPLITAGTVTVKRNIRTHYHSGLIALKEIRATGLFLEGGSYLLGKTYFDFLGCSRTNGPEQVVENPIGKVASFTSDSSQIINRDDIECYQCSDMGDNKGDFRSILKVSYLDDESYREELEYMEEDDDDDEEDSHYDQLFFMSLVSLDYEKLYKDILDDKNIFITC